MADPQDGGYFVPPNNSPRQSSPTGEVRGDEKFAFSPYSSLCPALSETGPQGLTRGQESSVSQRMVSHQPRGSGEQGLHWEWGPWTSIPSTTFRTQIGVSPSPPPTLAELERSPPVSCSWPGEVEPPPPARPLQLLPRDCGAPPGPSLWSRHTQGGQILACSLQECYKRTLGLAAARMLAGFPPCGRSGGLEQQKCP